MNTPGLVTSSFGVTIPTPFQPLNACAMEGTPSSTSHYRTHKLDPLTASPHYPEPFRNSEFVSSSNTNNPFQTSTSSGMRRNFSSESLIAKDNSLDQSIKMNYLRHNSLHCSQSSINNKPSQKSVHMRYPKYSLQEYTSPFSNQMSSSSKSHRRNLSAGNAPLYMDGALAGCSISNRLSNSNALLSSTLSSRGFGLASNICSTDEEPMNDGHYHQAASSVWSLQCQDGLVIVGCADGSIEVWDAYDGRLKFLTEEFISGSGSSGVTHMSVSGSRLVVARLSGAVDLYTVHASNTTKIDTEAQVNSNTATNNTTIHNDAPPFLSSFPPQPQQPPTPQQDDNRNSVVVEGAYKRGSVPYRHHRRLGSYDMQHQLISSPINSSTTTTMYYNEHNRLQSSSQYQAQQQQQQQQTQQHQQQQQHNRASEFSDEDYEVWLVRDVTTKAHHQPISVLCTDRSRVLTGSLDHTLKVICFTALKVKYLLFTALKAK